MKIKSIAAITSLLILGSTGVAIAAPAGELYPANVQQTQPAATKTRAQVVEELSQARATGQIADGEVGYAFGTPAQQDSKQTTAIAANTRSRAAVHAEAVQAAHDGYAVASNLRK